MLRGAAKNHEFVTVVVDPADYPRLLGELDRARRRDDVRVARGARGQRLCAHGAVRHHGGAVADAAAPHWRREPFRRRCRWCLRRCRTCATARTRISRPPSIARPRVPPRGIAAAHAVQGKELSFNNIADADTAIECVRQFAAARLRDRQACQSLRRRAGRQPALAPTRRPIAPIRCPPSAASSPSIANWTPRPRAASSADSSPKSLRRPRSRPPRVRCSREAGHPRAGSGTRRPVRTAADAGEVELRSIAGGLLVQTPDAAHIGAARPQGGDAPRADAAGAR